MPTITLTDEQMTALITSLVENVERHNRYFTALGECSALKARITAHERDLEKANFENEALIDQIAKLTERIAELEAENTPPEGCDASWKRANLWVAPPDERGRHEVRYADGTFSDVGRDYARDSLGVTFP